MEKNIAVDKYIAEAPARFRAQLLKLRQEIFELFPEGEEVYAYQIPVYRYRGKALFSLAAFKDHYSLITQDKDIASKIPELSGYKISGTTVHFTIDKPLSKELLAKVIKQRLADRG